MGCSNDKTLNQNGFGNISHSELNGVNNKTYSTQWDHQNIAALSRKNTYQSHNDLKQGSGNSIVVTQFNY